MGHEFNAANEWKGIKHILRVAGSSLHIGYSLHIISIHLLTDSLSVDLTVCYSRNLSNCQRHSRCLR